MALALPVALEQSDRTLPKSNIQGKDLTHGESLGHAQQTQRLLGCQCHDFGQILRRPAWAKQTNHGLRFGEASQFLAPNQSANCQALYLLVENRCAYTGTNFGVYLFLQYQLRNSNTQGEPQRMLATASQVHQEDPRLALRYV